MDHHRDWLEQHGFYCAALRSTLTPKACADNRARPAWGEEGYTTSYYRPTPCNTCTDWQRLCGGLSAGKEEDMREKKQGKCVRCGEVKAIAARGLCWSCYEKEKKDPDPPSGENRTSRGQENDQPQPQSATPGPSTMKSLLIEVCFDQAPEVHRQLVALAEDELRDPGPQVVWLLRQLFRKAEHLGGANEHA